MSRTPPELVERLARTESDLQSQIAYTDQLEGELDQAQDVIRTITSDLRSPGTGRHRAN